LTFKKFLFFCFFAFVTGAIYGQDFVQISEIKIVGNTQTKAWIIQREMNIKAGDSLLLKDTAALLGYNVNQLLNLNLFNHVYLQLEGTVLIVNVLEQWYWLPIPTIEVADRNFNQWLLSKDPSRLIYGLELKLKNLRGRNESFYGTFAVGYTKIADFKYVIPALRKHPNTGLILEAGWLANREVWYKTANNKVQFYDSDIRSAIVKKKLGITFSRRKGNQIYHNFYANFNQTKLKDNEVNEVLNPSMLGNGNAKLTNFGVGYNFILDKRDIRGQPLVGNYYNTNISVNYVTPNTQYAIMPLLNYRSSHFRHLKGRWFTSTGFHLKASFPPKQAYVLNRAIGYEYNVMRGYEYYVIDGNHSAVVKTNLKYAILLNKNLKFSFIPVKNYKRANNTLFAVAFFDAGYAHNRYALASNTFANEPLYGYGIGAEWIVWFDRIVRLEFANNHINKPGVYLSFRMGI